MLLYGEWYVSKKRKPRITPPPPEARLYNVAAAAAYLGSTPNAVRTLYWSKELPAIRLGQRLLFDKLTLDEFIEKQKQKSLAEDPFLRRQRENRVGGAG